MDIAAPSVARRAGAGGVLVLLGFLLVAPPVFVLGPLAALLAVSRPGNWRERIWLAAAVTLTALSLGAPGDIAQQVVRAGAMGLAGATLAVAVAGRQSDPFRQSVTAVVAAAFGTVTWAAVLGMRFAAFRDTIADALRAQYQALAAGSSASSSPEMQQLVQSLVDSADMVASLYPGMLVVLGVAGCMLAWQWLHRIAATPVGRAPGRFRAFRFNDHVIWGGILTLAAWLIPAPEAVQLVAANLLVAWAALYLVRGLAVATSLLAGSPWPMRVVAILFGILFLPFVSGALLAMGLADIWMDFRRRTPPVPGGHAE
ncbi:MAG: DUF2232 domain-containing protein [Gemmatimonadota bacterium]|nr:DUF2232 domain-containing protein [Gemmatimonadota bacterium]